MNFIDIIIIIPLLWFGYKGFTKGFVIETASFAALLLGIYGGLKLSGWLSGYLAEWFEIKSEYLPLISFSVTFLLIVLIVFLVARGVDKLVKSAALSLPNRLAGAVIGAAKTFIIIGVVLLLLNKYDKGGGFIKQDIRNNSLLYNPMTALIVKIYPSVSENLGKILGGEDKAQEPNNENVVVSPPE